MMNYLKNFYRIQARYKWFTLINVSGVALGIMCSTILFLYVDFHIGTDTHHRDAGQLYRLVLDIHTPEGLIEHEEGTALPMAEALYADYSMIEATAFCMRFYSAPTITITGSKNLRFKEAHAVAYADNNFITLFGHDFIAGDKRTALIHPASVVLSRKQALKYFGTTEVIGRSININHKADAVVTGVFADPVKYSDLQFDVLVSLPTLKVLNPNYQEQNFTWIGSNNWTFLKLRKAVSAADVNGQLPAFVEKYLGNQFRHWKLHLQPLSDVHFDVRYGGVISRTVLWVLTGVALALVCIVCINYINLSIAQMYRRAREIGIRKCLGGSRAQVFFQFIAETSILVLVSVCLGFLGSYLVLPFVNRWMQLDLVLTQLITPDKLTYLFLFCIGLVLLAGYYPAVLLSGFDPVRALAGKPVHVGGTAQVFRKALICFQYAVALLFLISTMVVAGQVDYLLKSDSGFSRDGIVTVNLPKRDFSRLETFRNEVAGLPGVLGASLHHQPPMAVTTDGGFIKYANGATWEDFIVRDRWADDHFVETYALEVIAGRDIVLHDSSAEVLVNETLLRKLNIEDPNAILNRTLLFDNSAVAGTVVGVVKDFHHRSLQTPVEPVAIYPFKGVFNQLGIKLSAEDRGEAVAAIESLWKKYFPDDLCELSFLDESIASMYHVEQTTGKLMKVFTAVSMVICCMGVLGLSALSTHQRTKEIGIRKVLGATFPAIIYLLCRQYIVLIMIACLVSVPIAYSMMRLWLTNFAYHISPRWFEFCVPVLLMMGITILLTGLQSLKTVLINPARSLKQE